MRDDPRVVALVTRASGGDQDAWHELVERYASLVYTVCARYRLSNDDIEDVGQSVWLLLTEQLGKLREPAALPGWLATTTARECLRVVTAANKAERLGTGLDDSVLFVDDAVIDEEILVAERNAALRAAFAELPPEHRMLLEQIKRGENQEPSEQELPQADSNQETSEADGERELSRPGDTPPVPVAVLLRKSAAQRLLLRRQLVDKSAFGLTCIAAFLAGQRGPDLRDEWRAHLAGRSGHDPVTWRKIGTALKFIGAVIMMRLQDVADVLWVPVDAALKSRTFSNLIIWVPFIVAVRATIRNDGFYGLVTNADNLIELWGGLYAIIRAGRWWRDVKPPKHKPRSSRE